MTRLLITNGQNNHSPDEWALATAEMLADASDLSGDKLVAANKLRAAFADVLKKHHDDVQRTERELLASDPKHILTRLADVIKTDAKAVAEELAVVAQGSLWAAHYAADEVKATLARIIENHFHTSMAVERLLHTDRNPDCEHAKAFRAKYEGGAN